jgi:putative Mn2+ efflux pump MntP
MAAIPLATLVSIGMIVTTLTAINSMLGGLYIRGVSSYFYSGSSNCFLVFLIFFGYKFIKKFTKKDKHKHLKYLKNLLF